MRYLPALALIALFYVGNGLAQQTTGTTTTTVIPRPQIANVLKQALPEAPKQGGGGLYDGPNYRIGALRRSLPGEAEIHRNDTDIIYVLSGKATLQTGGSVVGLHPTSATEERGTAIANGVRHTLNAGDMVIVPKGEPHWFQAISAEVSYLVIKVQ